MQHFNMRLTDVSLQIDGPLNKENLCEAPISKAVQMTSGDSVKTALLLELDISVSLINWSPKHYVLVLCTMN